MVKTMSNPATAVSPQRFAQGRTWDEYLDYIASPENLARPHPNGGPREDSSDRFRRNDRTFDLTPQESAAFRSLPQLTVLVIGEDWCPDVQRGLPVVATIARAADWDLRIFQRDEHSGLIAPFRLEKDGERHESLPVAVLYDHDPHYLGHWTERPTVANDYMDAHPEIFLRREGESVADHYARIFRCYRDLRESGAWAQWQHATARELLDLARDRVSA